MTAILPANRLRPGLWDGTTTASAIGNEVLSKINAMRSATALAVVLLLIAQASAESQTPVPKEPLAQFAAKVKFIEVIGKREGEAVPVGTQFDLNWLVGIEITSIEKAAKPIEKKGNEMLLIHSPSLFFGKPAKKVVGKQFSFKLFGEVKDGGPYFHYAEVEEQKTLPRKGERK